MKRGLAIGAGGALVSGGLTYFAVQSLRKRFAVPTPAPRPAPRPAPMRPAPSSLGSPCDVPHTDEFTDHPPLARGSEAEVRTAATELRGYLVKCGATMSYLSMNELTLLESAGEYAVPARSLWPRLARTVRVWERIRSRFGRPITITSAYRPSDHNARVGGAKRSSHVLASALEFTVDTRREELARLALQVFHERGVQDAVGLGIYGYPTITHFHLDTGRRYRMIEQTPSWRRKYMPDDKPLPITAGAWNWRGWNGRTIGRGVRPVVVLHGMAATTAQIEPLIPRDAARFWLVEGQVPSKASGWNYFETRSSSPSFAAGLSRAREDIAPLLDAIKTRVGTRPHALGYSQGGHLALGLAVTGHVGVAVVAAAALPRSLWPRGDAPRTLQRLHIIHGAVDRVVKPESSRALAAELIRRGWPVSYEELPGVGHNLAQLWPAMSTALFTR